MKVTSVDVEHLETGSLVRFTVNSTDFPVRDHLNDGIWRNVSFQLDAGSTKLLQKLIGPPQYTPDPPDPSLKHFPQKDVPYQALTQKTITEDSEQHGKYTCMWCLDGATAYPDRRCEHCGRTGVFNQDTFANVGRVDGHYDEWVKIVFEEPFGGSKRDSR